MLLTLSRLSCFIWISFRNLILFLPLVSLKDSQVTWINFSKYQNVCSDLVIVTRDIIKSASGDLHFALQLFIQGGDANAFLRRNILRGREFLSQCLKTCHNLHVLMNSLFMDSIARQSKNVIIKLTIWILYLLIHSEPYTSFLLKKF